MPESDESGQDMNYRACRHDAFTLGPSALMANRLEPLRRKNSFPCPVSLATVSRSNRSQRLSFSE